jgi:hypothetical protein
MGSHCKRQRVMSLAPITAVAMAAAVSTQFVLVSAAAPTKTMSHSVQLVAATAQNSPSEHVFDQRSRAEGVSRSAEREALADRIKAAGVARAADVQAARTRAADVQAARTRAASAARSAARSLHERQAQALASQRAAVHQAAQRATARRLATQRTLTAGNLVSPKAYAKSLVASDAQYRCLVLLWTRESGWNHLADNPSSDAYGIPQSLPGSKMASAGADWRTNPATQIRWGLGYIRASYGTPCGAWAHSQTVGWY